ncbi:MAG: hypothetical protein AAGJ81_02190 [Verrucomicrobiota bacterium]
MFFSVSRSAFVVWLILTSASFVVGQGFNGEPPPMRSEAEEEEPEPYLMNILYLSKEPMSKTNLGFPLHFRNNEKDFRINTIPGSLTRTIRYQGNPNFFFFKPETSAEGEITRIPLVNINLGKPGRKIIFLTRDEKQRISARVMHVGRETLPENTVRVMNFSQQSAVIRVDEEDARLNSMDAEDFRIKSDKPRFRVRLAMAGHDGESTYVFENKKMAMAQGARELILLYPNPREPQKLTYSLFPIRDEPFQSNYSDAEISDEGYRDAYVPSRYRN